MEEIIYRVNNSKKNKQIIEQNLELYNFTKNEYLNPIMYKKKQKKFGIYAYINDEIVGGAYGFVDSGYWFYLDLLFVDENYRNIDVATNLIKIIEKFAKENKCVGIRTETWSFQAKGFYEKMGFTVYGQLENHPPYAIDYMLKKDLIIDEKDFPEPIK